MADPIPAQTKCEPAKIRQCKEPPLYDIPGHFSGADPTSAEHPVRDGPCHCVRELCRGAADETLMVGRADVEGERQDVQGKSDILACWTVGVHKARDARKMLDTGEVLNEGMAYESGEGLTHLYPRSGAGEGYVRCVCDAQTE